jgi:NADH-quinone oxidoreductase subunit M
MAELLLCAMGLPLLGALGILAINKENKTLLKNYSLGVSLLTFVVSLFLLSGFDSNNANFQFYFSLPWIPSIDAGFRVGVDGMSMLLVMLTTFLSPITILSSFSAIEKREKEYYFFILMLEFAMLGVFVSLDLFLFYIFWELILIPMYFIIGIWGGKERLYATVKFFIFTVVGSLFMLAAIVWLGVYVGSYIMHSASGFTTNYIEIGKALASSPIPMDAQKWIFLAFALSFCIKVPLFPLHTWLPDAHTEAPTPGSVILAGVLLKMGTYGLVRFNLQLLPQASIEYAGVISTLAVIGIIYGALVAMIQTDIKRLVAYSSVSHLGFVVLGIFSITEQGLQGAIIQMVNHGLSTGMLFLCVGMIYERRHTRDISAFGGITKVMPKYAVFFAIAMFASMGLPGLNGFVGEFLTLMGAFQSHTLNSWAYTIFATTGVIFAAVYLLWMFQRVMFGENSNPENHHLKDINKREMALLIPLTIFILWLGIYPNSFLKISEKSTITTIEKVSKSRGTVSAPVYENVKQ